MVGEEDVKCRQLGCRRFGHSKRLFHTPAMRSVLGELRDVCVGRSDICLSLCSLAYVGCGDHVPYYTLYVYAFCVSSIQY